MPLNDDGGIGGGGRISNSRSVDSHLDRLDLNCECIYCTRSLVVFDHYIHVVLIVNIYCACHLVVYKPPCVDDLCMFTARHLVVYKPLVLMIYVYLLHMSSCCL